MLDDNIHLTRRFFYFISPDSNPIVIIHAVDASSIKGLYGEPKIYTSFDDLDRLLKELISGKIAMEYSPHGDLPYLSKVDGGTLEKIKSFGVIVVSSAPLLQHFGSILTDKQKLSHLKAAQALQEAFEAVLDYIDKNLHQAITEYDASKFIANFLKERGFELDHDPIVAVNSHSAIAHYCPSKETSAVIKPHDFILIDLWCKSKEDSSVYADICRVATLKRKPTLKEQEVFDVVLKAQKSALDYLKAHKDVTGYEVDKVARDVIEKAGFGPYFTHRLGHNIYTSCHGDGAHIDSFETKDIRKLLPKTCFSIEPGIYLEGEFGIRLETDIYIEEDGKINITAGLQEHIIQV
jgi:Xaa-Pro aminopeptidase